jgi:hypothetical protein
MSLFCGPAAADQAVYVTREQALRAREILEGHVETRRLCEPCGDTRPEAVSLSGVSVKNEEEDWWAVYLDGESVDMAYVYVLDGGRWVNLARMASIDVKEASDAISEGFSRILTVGNDVNVRDAPGVHGRPRLKAKYGDTFTASAALVRARDGSAWYGIVSPDGEGKPSPRMYVSAAYAVMPPLSLDDEELVSRVSGVKFSDAANGPVDASDVALKSQASALMAGLPWEARPREGVDAVTIYRERDRESGVVKNAEDSYFQVTGWGPGGPGSGWLRVRGTRDKSVVGWALAEQLCVIQNDSYASGDDDAKAIAFISRAILSLGEGAEAERKWGRALANERNEFAGADENARVVRTVQKFDGVSIERNEVTESGECEEYYTSGGFTFSREGAGIGGLFIGRDWCDASYIERVVGHPRVEEDDGRTTLVYEDKWDGAWLLGFTLDESGALSKITYQWSVH